MKVRTLDGRGLRSAGYTEFECHALIHAAGHCAAGETFQGVPTSANVVYQKSDDTFFVAARDTGTRTRAPGHGHTDTGRATGTGQQGQGNRQYFTRFAEIAKKTLQKHV